MKQITFRQLQTNTSWLSELPVAVTRYGKEIAVIIPSQTYKPMDTKTSDVVEDVTASAVRLAATPTATKAPEGPPPGFKFPVTPAFTKVSGLPSANPGYKFDQICETCGNRFDKGPHTRYSENGHAFVPTVEKIL